MASNAGSTLCCVLASQSPRRAELLAQINVDFEVASAAIDESVQHGETAADYVQRLSAAKAQVIWQLREEQGKPALAVLGSDTSVVIGTAILGKPCDRDEAKKMLQALSGRQHEVLTSVSVVHHNQCLTRLNTTKVNFRVITPAEIDTYIDTDEPYDKAGGYGIQGLAAVFIDNIDGSYSAVMGLPLQETYQLLHAIQ